MGKTGISFIVTFLALSLKASSQQHFSLLSQRDVPFARLNTLPQNFYTNHLGFFCKKESQLQKLTQLPIYLRLGNKGYVDYLEQKPNAKKEY